MVAGIPKFLLVPASQRRAVTQAVRKMPAVRRSLHERGYAETLAWLRSCSRPSLEKEERGTAAKRTNHVIETLPGRTSCLERSLVVWWVAGEDAELKLGVAPGEGSGPHRFHAWVEQNGVVINDSPEVAAEFLPLIGQAAEATDPAVFD